MLKCTPFLALTAPQWQPGSLEVTKERGPILDHRRTQQTRPILRSTL